MYPDQVSAKILDIHDELRRLLAHLEEFPEPSAVGDVQGGNASVARPFDVQLRSFAQTAANLTRLMMVELSEMDGAVRAALDDLVEHDAELASSAERLTSFLDDAAGTTDTSSSQGSRTGMGGYGGAG